MTEVRSHLRLPVTLSAGALMSRFFDGIRDGQIFGTRCGVCRTLYVPPRSFCAACWTTTDGWEQVRDTGVVTAFVIVNVPFYGQQIAIPYTLADIRLDGATSTFKHLVGRAGDDGTVESIPVATGMRVRAVWRADRTGFISEDIDHFTPEDA